MKYAWLDEYLMAKRGVTKDLQTSWNWVRYKLDGKMFAASCLNEKDEPYYITLKQEPSDAEFLRQQYEDIIPGYYMNKVHWISIKADGAISDEMMKELLDKSYQVMLNSFSGKKQREILLCDIWRATKDPNMSDEEFETNIAERVKNLNF